MNFSYMIILLLILMGYIYLSIKPRTYYMFVYILILLVLYEIYNQYDIFKEQFYDKVTCSNYKDEKQCKKMKKCKFNDDNKCVENTAADGGGNQGGGNQGGGNQGGGNQGGGNQGGNTPVTTTPQAGSGGGGGRNRQFYFPGNTPRPTGIPQDITDEYGEEYDFSKPSETETEELNPYDYSRNEFKQVEVPYKYSKQLKGGLTCEAQRKTIDYLKQKGQLVAQSKYTDKYERYLINHIQDEYKRNLDYIQKTTYPSTTQNVYSSDEIDAVKTPLVTYESYAVGQGQTIDEVNASIFKPIESDRLAANKKCPTVCHIIKNKDRCKNHKFIPYMDNINDFYPEDPNNPTFGNSYFKIDKLNKCENFKKDEKECDKDTDCTFNKDYKRCYYDKLGCFHHDINVPKGDTTCHTRCEFLNVDNNNKIIDIKDDSIDSKKSRTNCRNAAFFDTTKKEYINYCRWKATDQSGGRCFAECKYLGTDLGYTNDHRKNECLSSPKCIWDDDKFKCDNSP